MDWWVCDGRILWHKKRWIGKVPLKEQCVFSRVPSDPQPIQQGAHLGGHDPINTCLLQTLIRVFSVEDVSVGKHGNLNGLFDGLDLLPICQSLYETARLMSHVVTSIL